MTKKEEKGKKKDREIIEIKIAGDVMKRMRVMVPKDLKEPKTPGPTKKPKKEKRE